MKKIFFFTTGLFAIAVYSNAQNVGIGTNTPTFKLHVVGDANGIFGSGNTYGVRGSGGTYGLYGSGSSYGVYGSGVTYGVYGSSSNNYGVVGSSGYLGVYGIGSTYGLYGSGGTYGAYASGISYGVYGNSSGGYGVYGGSTSNWAVYGNGYIGTYGLGAYVGTWGNGTSYGLVGYGGPYGVWAQGSSYAGYFQGNVHATGVYSGSDKALKKNITEFSSAMDIINKLKPRRYEFRNDGNYAQMNLPSGSHYGLIAQDVEQVLPNLVKATEFKKPVSLADQDGKPFETADNAAASKLETIDFKAVNYTELIPIMIKAMQEQDAKITEQQTQNEKLQNQVNELRSLVQGLSKKVHITTGITPVLYPVHK